MLPHQFRDNAPCQLGSSYGMRMMPLFPRQHNSPKRKAGNEKVTGRKARGLQMEEIGCNYQTFLSLLNGRRKHTSDIFFFFPSLYKFKRRLLFKILCCHNDTWFHLKLTILKAWVNQCNFLMDMFVLRYVNVLCIYPRLCLQVGCASTLACKIHGQRSLVGCSPWGC